MADSVIVPLAEFVALNAGFSFASDITAQYLECRTPKKRRAKLKRRRAPAAPHPAADLKPPPSPPLPHANATSPPPPPLSCENSSFTCEEATLREPPPPDSDSEVEEAPTVQPFPDWTRARNFACTGVIFCGVAQFVRLRVISEVFANRSDSILVAVGKTGFNQLLFSPLVRAASMGTIQYLRTKDLRDVKAKLASDFVEAQTMSYMVKPVSNFVAFAIFPHHILAQ
eukprot:Sspe_Gene.61759::Locus_34377_Transcript_1_1_Confidence_1.000_Length_768::g.61759::m.61759/K13348/MPV17; protein Mpv17